MNWLKAGNQISLMSFLGVLCLSISCGILAYFRYNDAGVSLIAFSCIAIIIICTIALKLFPAKGPKTIVVYSFVPLILFGFWLYIDSIFGAFDWSAILFHMNTGLDDSNAVTIYYKIGMIFAVSIVLISIGILILKNSSSLFKYFDIVAAIALLIFNPAITSVAKETLQFNKQSDALLKVYEEPVAILKEGQKPRNFIHIFLESAERTYFDEAAFGPIAQPLKELEPKGFSTTKLLQARDTSWTAAGIAAAQCGVPLSPFGILSFNHFGLTSEFLTNATCLGDILSEHDYDLTYVQGSDVSFGGMQNLFGKHGYQTVLGFHKLEKLYPNRERHSGNEGRNDWGFADDTLFHAGFDLLVEAQSKDKPFGIVLESIGGHSPTGNLAPECKGRPELEGIDTSILAANYCTNLLTKEFLEKAEQQGLLENTVVIVQSDHLTSKSQVSYLLDARERANFFVMFGDGVPMHQSSMPATMMDVFPTVLEAIGFEIVDGKAGVGYSLLSSDETLVSQYGLEKLDTMIIQDNTLAPILWGQKPKSGVLTGSNTK